MRMPNFLIIGTMKAGTSSLYHYLKQHPEIFMSPIKEPHFFAFEEGILFAGPGDHKLRPRQITNVEAYRNLFTGATDEKAVGEASTSYLYSPTAPACIRNHLPEAKLIAILRDPVERAYSNYLYWARRGYEPLTDFWQAIQAEQTRIRENWAPEWHYFSRGLYHRQVERYVNVFSRSQIRIYLYDDLVANAPGLMQDIFRFLDVDETFVPDVSVRYNLGGLPRSKALKGLLARLHPVTSIFKPLLSEELRQRLKKAIKRWNLREAPPLSEEVRTRLRGLYREDILRLQDLIQRDLSKWLD
jgi:hypothetical protein